MKKIFFSTILLIATVLVCPLTWGQTDTEGLGDALGENEADTTAVTPDSLLSRSLEPF